jgi:hypothetical protein
MELSTLEVSIGPVGIAGTGLPGTGGAVVVVIAIVIWLLKARPSLAFL